MPDSAAGLVKIVLKAKNGDHEDVETLWAKQVGPNIYVLDNPPWYAYGVSAGDLLEALPTKEDPRPLVRRVLRKSGNRTVRVILNPPIDESNASQAILDRLREMGCDHEGANRSYFAVNLPPAVDFEAVCRFLTETGQQWEHADPTYKELYPDDDHGNPDAGAG
jgi:hypothetical protein